MNTGIMGIDEGDEEWDRLSLPEKGERVETGKRTWERMMVWTLLKMRSSDNPATRRVGKNLEREFAKYLKAKKLKS